MAEQSMLLLDDERDVVLLSPRKEYWIVAVCLCGRWWSQAAVPLLARRMQAMVGHVQARLAVAASTCWQ